MEIARQSLRSIVRAWILLKVTRGQIAAGDRVNETARAGEFGVSQTPIREALLGLEREGFLTSVPGKGFSVASLCLRDGGELYPLQARLEGDARELTPPVGLDVIHGLRKDNDKFRAAAKDDPAQALTIDSDWHAFLLKDCPNLHLLRLIKRQRRPIHRYEYAHMAQGGNIEASAD